MRRKFLLSWFLMLLLITGNSSILNANEENVAKVGNTEYATIDEAIANWTNNTTLTLLANVTLSDVIKLSSTEYHILDLGTYTMTAASKKDAIQIVNNGRSSASYALDIKADATNPGGITATGKAVVRTAGKSGVKDRPIIRFYNGVFDSSYIVYHSGSNGTNCPQFWFYDGVFNGTIYTNRTLNQFYGGIFNGSMSMSVDSSAYTLVAGGTFKNLSNTYGSALNNQKFTIGTAKGVYDRDVYIDDNGNTVIAAKKPKQGEDGIQADVAKNPGTNDYLYYSKVETEGQLGYTNVEKALNDNKSGEVTVYVEEIDMTGINFTGTIVVPEGNDITIINAPADGVYVQMGSDNPVVRLTPNASGTITTEVPDGATPITDFASLKTALQQAGSYSYALMNNITVTEQINISQGTEVTLDLNGHKITASDKIYPINNDGILTINDSGEGGTIEGLGIRTGYTVNRSAFAELYINGGIFRNVYSEGAALYVHNGTVTINGGKFYGQNIAIANHGGNINAKDCYIDGYNYAIEAVSLTKINNATISGVCVINEYIAATNVTFYEARIGEAANYTSYRTLAEAVQAAESGDVVQIIKEGSYDLPEFREKTLTFEGVTLDKTKTSIKDYVDKGSQGMTGSTVNFKNLTINGANGNYNGLFHTAGVTYENCDIYGLRFLYSPTTFTNCAFNAAGVEHSFWTYGASNVTVTGCTFTYTDRAVNCYSEAGANHELDITFSDCDFVYAGSSDEPAGAVEINSSSVKSMDVAFTNDCTAPEKGEMWYISEWDADGGDNTIVQVNGETVFEVLPVAKIGNVEYKKLQKAIDAAQNNETITLLRDCGENVTITQKADVKFTIDGAQQTMTGAITVDGKSATIMSAGVTIKNVKFNANNITTDAAINLGVEGDDNTRYTCNVTVDHCTFTGTGQTTAAVKSYTGGDKNLTITNCNVDNTMHSLAQVAGVDNVTITNTVVNSKNGVNLNSCTNVEMTGCNFSVQGYAVRIGAASDGASGAITLENNTLKTNNSEGDAVIVIRGNAVTQVDLSMEKNVVSGATHISGNTTDTKISADANYWDGKEAPVATTPIVVNSYYTDEALTNLVRIPMGDDFTAYTREDAIWGEVGGNAVESFVIKVLDAGGIVMGTTTLNNVGGIIDGSVYVTWSLKLDAASNTDEYWTMQWTTAPSIDNMPAKVELYVDGTRVGGGDVVLNAPDNLSKINAANIDVNGKILAYRTTLPDAVANGDNVAILAPGTYAVPTGKNLTITGAVENVKFDMSNAVGINSSMTFNNVTFEYGNANYVGLQHAGTMVYNNCTINGQVFLYGTSEEFNNCTFNQDSSDAYNVWTYGAAQVAFNECTFNSAGKSVLIYTESPTTFNTVTVTNCDFIASAPVDGKAAIEMDSSLSAGINLTIDGETTATGFGSGNVSGNSLWNNKKGASGVNNDITVTVAGVVVLQPEFEAQIGETKYEFLSEAIAAVGEGDVVIKLLKDATLDYNAREAYGKPETTSLTINGNGKTLTLNQKDSDWSSFGLANADAKVVFNNMTIEKTGYGDTSGAWNTHTIIFSSNVEMTDVTVNNSMAVQGGATLNNVTINEANGYYGLWINGNGQSVTMDGGSITATNGGRGIKIADQYIDAPASVTLNVTGTTFNTAEKAAVLVSSTAGAMVTAEGCDITNVAADNTNFVWVDEDWAAYYNNVKVYDEATKTQENEESFPIKVYKTDINGTVRAYFKNLDELFAAKSTQIPLSDNYIELRGDVVANNKVNVSYSNNYYYNFGTSVENGVTMTFNYADNWNMLPHFGLGENITMNVPYLQVIGGEISIAGTLNTGYLSLYGTGEGVVIEETGVVNANVSNDKTVQVKGGTVLTVKGELNTSTLNVWTDDANNSELIVSGANAEVNAAANIHAWNAKDGVSSQIITVEDGAKLTATSLQADRGSVINLNNATIVAPITLGYDDNVGTLVETGNSTVEGNININSTTSTVTSDGGLENSVSTNKDGYMVVLEDGVYRIAQIVAKIGTTTYASLQDATNAANSGDVIELCTIASMNENVTAQIPAGVTIKSNGFSIDGSIRMLGDLTLDGPLTITGGLWVGNTEGTLDATLAGDKLTAKYFMFQRGSYNINADIDAVYGYLSFEATFEVNSTITTTNTNGEPLYINGNVNLNNEANLTAKNIWLSNENTVLNVKEGASVIVSVRVNVADSGAELYSTGNISGLIDNSSNGTIVISGGVYTNPIQPDWCADGFIPKDNGDGTYGVVEGLAGDGTATEPYIINSLIDLKYFRDAVNAGDTYAGKTVVLADDIDLAEGQTRGANWTPISTFNGTFDGANYTISNLVIEGGTNSNQGFFGQTNNGEIKNLTFNNAKVSGRLNVGVVAGTPYTSKYTNIKVTGHVEVNGMSYVGGVGGKNAYANWTGITVDVDNTSYVKAVSTEGDISYRTYVGGVIGFNGEGGHTFKNISSNINVEGDVCDIGGIFGILHYGNKVENVSCSATVTSESEANELGGIAGVWHNQNNTTVSISNATFTGKVYDKNGEVKGVDIVGGAYHENGTGTITGSEAVVEGKTYETLAKAIEAAQSGDLVELLTNVNASEVILINKSLTISGNGHKVTSSANRVFRVTTANTEVTLNNVNMVSSAAVEYPSDVRGISIDNIENVTLTLNNCSVDFTHATANDWAYAVNVTGGNNHNVTVNGGTYEGANVINVRGASNTIVVKDATLNCTYPNNDMYYGACIYVVQEQGSSVEARDNIFNGENAVAFNIGTGTELTESSNTDNTKYVVAKVGETYYYSLEDAFAALQDGATVKVLKNNEVTETLKVNYNITLDLNGKTITGTDDATASFALIEIQPGKELTVTDGTVEKNGKITLTATNDRDWNAYSSVISNQRGTLTVNGGTIEHLGGTDMAYGIDNLTNGKGTYAETVINGGTVKSTYRAIRQFLNGTEAQNILTVNGGTIEGINKSIWMQDTNKNANTGTLTVGEGASLKGDVYLFVTEGSTEWPVEVSIAAAALAEGSEVMSANVPTGYDVQLRNNVWGVYSVVAKINETGELYPTLAEAVTAAQDSQTIELIYAEGDAPIAMNASLYGKEVTITGTATVDWSKGFLFVGRGGVGNATLTFDGAKLTSASNNATYGIHVSGREKDTNDKYNGTVKIKNSTIELDYLINKGTMTLDESTLTVKNGFSVGGRPASETESGEDATATMTLSNNSKVVVINHNGMGLGHEAIGVMDINSGSTFETTQDFLITAKGTMNVDATGVIVNGTKKITNNGKINFSASTIEDVTIDGSGTTYFSGEINFNGANSITSNINGTPFELVVNKGANLLISRFVLGYDRAITVYGNIEDAHNLTAEQIASMTPSLKFNSTSGVSVGGTDTGRLTAEDAYLEFDSSSWKDSEAEHIWNFENCYVSATSFGNNNAQGSTTSTWDVTFDNSVLAAKNYIKNGVGVTYNFTNCSVATTGSLRIDGTLNVDANSSVTTTAQQNNVQNAVDEHGGINGTINIAGTLTIGSNAATQLEVLGGEVNVNGGTINLGDNTLTLDEASNLSSYGNIYGAITAAAGATIILTGGTYTQDVNEWCHADYDAEYNGNNTWTVIQVAGTQTRELATPGWYWFSTYIDLEGSAGLEKLQNAFNVEDQNGNIVCVGNSIKSRTQFSQYYDGYGWDGNLQAITTAQMYMINTDPVTLELTGDFVEAGRQIPLVYGWNSIGYPVRNTMSINDAFENIFVPTEGDVFKSKNKTSFYEDGEWFPEITLEPGHGYMYQSKSSESKTLVYKSNNNRNTENKTNIDEVDYHWLVDATQYPGNMTIVAMLSIDNEIVKYNYEIAAFANGECRGSARPMYNDRLGAYILILTIHGEEVEELTFKYYDVNYGTEYELSNRINYSDNAIVGSFEEPYMFNLGILNIDETSVDQISIYPNPTTTGKEINLQAMCDKVEVFNALGVKVAEYTNVDSIDALETAGIYVIRVTIDGNARNCRLVVR